MQMVMNMKFIQAHDYPDTKSKNMEFFVNSCGYFSKIDRNSFTYRPDGRSDYQLIYVTEGRFYTENNGKVTCHSPGEAVLYRPGELQHYYCKSNDNSAYFWIHFDGSFAEGILSSCGFKDKSCIYAPVSKEDIRIIHDMTEEIRRKLMGYHIRLLSLFCQLCVNIGRRSSGDIKNMDGYSRLQNAIRSMEHDPGAKYNVEEYADMCGMSRYHFMHIFKDITGKSPIQYRNDLRLAQAASLLKHTDMSVKSIADSMGFEDPLYFSRCFNKSFGLSPQQYRQDMK